jgi:hypothetical protein
MNWIQNCLESLKFHVFNFFNFKSLFVDPPLVKKNWTVIRNSSNNKNVKRCYNFLQVVLAMQSRVLYNLLQTPAEGEEGWPQNFCELIFRDFFC